jgi:hypothetical protein
MSNNTEEPQLSWPEKWFIEFHRLIKEDEENWIERIKEWEINNPAPQPSGPIITIPKMDTQQKEE